MPLKLNLKSTKAKIVPVADVNSANWVRGRADQADKNQ